MNIIKINSDHVGVTSGILCAIHCIFSPFFYVYQAKLSTYNFEAAFLWNSLNYIFIIISFVAVCKSILNSTNSIVKPILFSSWLILSILILNEQFEIIHLQEVYTYLSASILCVTHFYNLKNCRCDNDDCCSHKKF
tara:strand:+ start:15596 stop:16003 length:408 start_codon:yes stop_codon:yes gene_type:complete